MKIQAETRRTLVAVLSPAEDRIDPTDAARTAERLRGLPEGTDLLVRRPDGKTENLPRSLTHTIARMLEEVARGHTVVVVSEAEEVSTGRAAELLGVSRPHVVKLIDSGILPGRMAGTHRRVRMTDLLVYKRRTEDTHAILDDLVAESEALGLYDRPERRRA